MRRTAAVLMLLSLLMAGCSRGGVVVLSGDQLPEDLYALASPSPSAGLAGTAQVYLVMQGRLVGRMRLLGAADPGVEGALRALFAGPTQEESAQGVTSAIPPGVRLLTADISDSTASVNLSHEFELGAEQQVLIMRLAQVVYTVTESASVSRVRFLIDGEPVDVVSQDGAIHSGAVGRADYSSFINS